MEEIVCSKCHSSNLSANQKGFNSTNAALGMATIGGATGIGLGMMGSNKIIITCLKCGNQFKAGDGSIRKTEADGNYTIEKQEYIDRDKVIGRRIAYVGIVILVIIGIAIAAFFNSIGSKQEKQDTVQNISSSSIEVQNTKPQHKSDPLKPPFYGERYFNFAGGSGTGFSIVIKKNKQMIIQSIPSLAAGKPFTIYSGKYTSDIIKTTDGGLYRIIGNKIQELNEDGTTMYDCVEEGKPCIIELEKID
jgi:hypothetical protein